MWMWLFLHHLCQCAVVQLSSHPRFEHMTVWRTVEIIYPFVYTAAVAAMVYLPRYPDSYFVFCLSSVYISSKMIPEMWLIEFEWLQHHHQLFHFSSHCLLYWPSWWLGSYLLGTTCLAEDTGVRDGRIPDGRPLLPIVKLMLECFKSILKRVSSSS